MNQLSVSPPDIAQRHSESAGHSTQEIKKITYAVIGAAIGLTILGFLLGLRSDTTAGAFGRGFGTALQPVIPAAIIGWGNERRARIGYLVVAAIVFVINLISL